MASPADILKEHGDWIQSTVFNKLVAQRLGIDERTAYRKIKKAVNDSAIRKLTLPDRGVLYGLPTWPFPEAKKEELKNLGLWGYLKHRAEIKREEKSKQEREQRAEFYTKAEWLASVEEWGDIFKGLKDYADIKRKTRKELGLDE